MQAQPFRFGPVALTNAAANYLNGAITSTAGSVGIGTIPQPLLLLKHIRVVNKTAGAVTVSLFIGATAGSAAGTEFAWSARSVPANDSIDWFGAAPLKSTDFLTGLASANTSLTIQGEGEIGFNGAASP